MNILQETLCQKHSEADMFTEQLAKIILVPYLWWFGYDFDADSIQECHDAIDLQFSNDGGKGGVAPIGDQSFTAGRSDSSSVEGVTRSPAMRNQKRCLCGPECPYCSGSCSICDCIYKPLPPPGPGKIQWVRIRIQALRSRF